MSRYRLHWL